MIDLSALAASRNGHSVFSPSGSAMWLGCSGSLIPNLLESDTSGVDAAYGTVGHGVGEQWLKSGVKPTHLIGTSEFVENDDWGFMIEIDEAMLDHVQRYVDWCAFLPGEHFVEAKVYFSELTPLAKQGGTADHVACTFQRMVITDLKLGKGVQVYAKDNTQAQLYALGFFYEWDWLYDFQEFVIRIAQPRLDHMDEWIVSRAELLEFAEYAKVRAFAAWTPNAPRTPSAKACQWCKVQASCTANAILQGELTAGVFSDMSEETTVAEMVEFRDELTFKTDMPVADLASMSISDMALLYGFRGMAEKWWKSLGEALYRHAANGGDVPGYKLVESRSRRVFSNEPRAAARLVELGCPEGEVIEQVMCSPAEAEKLLRKAGHRAKDLPDLLSKLVYKPAGKPTLAPARDRRMAIVDLTAAAFGDLSENPENSESEEY